MRGRLHERGPFFARNIPFHFRGMRYLCCVSENAASRIKRVTPSTAPFFQEVNMNKTFRLLLAQGLLVAAGAAAVGSASAQVVVVAPSAPPPVRYEEVPAARAGYVWDHGHWRWDHGRYVWVPGHWQPERVGFHWVPGHWDQRGPNYHWVEGHWAR
jgi:hypothetical protein